MDAINETLTRRPQHSECDFMNRVRIVIYSCGFDLATIPQCYGDLLIPAHLLLPPVFTCAR